MRMYRVGFGDFFLVTVPSAKGPQHILIDCGVTTGKTRQGRHRHHQDGRRATWPRRPDGKLALIIVTHRHQDHIIGFSRCEDVFEKFKVDAIWMPIWETEYAPEVRQVPGRADLARARPAAAPRARRRPRTPRPTSILGMLENATGVSPTEGPGGGTNAKSLDAAEERSSA